LVDREKVLKDLNTPKLGDSLLKADGTPWLADLQKMAPKINWDDLTQTAALPLGSWIKTDPWDDKVHMLNAKRYAPMNARDKMPFEVTPIFFKLQRYETVSFTAPEAPAAGVPTAPATATPAAASPAAPAPPAADSGAQTGAPTATPSAAPQSPPPADQPNADNTGQQQPARYSQRSEPAVALASITNPRTGKCSSPAIENLVN
jgi:hypothetical protein